MKLNPYLIFDGQCKAAFTYYEQVLGGTMQAMMPFGDSPACGDIPKEYHDHIMHACLIIDGQMLMASDTTPQYPYEGIKGCSISLNVERIADAERIFNALADGGSVTMPLDKTFWAARFGMCTDRFGVPWMINCEKDQ